MDRKYEIRLHMLPPEALPWLVNRATSQLFDSLPHDATVKPETLRVDVTPVDLGGFMVSARIEARIRTSPFPRYMCQDHKRVLIVWNNTTCTWGCPVEGCKAFVTAEEAGWPEDE